MLTYEQVTKSEAIRTYITRADESLSALGFTEHSFSHVVHVSQTAGYILEIMWVVRQLLSKSFVIFSHILYGNVIDR